MIELLSCLLFVVAPLGLFIHELGHTIVGLWSGAERSSLSLGIGPTLFKCKIKRLTVQLHCIFFIGGYSYNEKEVNFTPKQQAMISLGGPLSNAICAAILYMSDLPQQGQVLQLFYLFNLYLALVNMIPFRLKGRESDGCRFLRGLTKITG
ncbi:site-2 protease family protein [Halobacillus shinanisalinarum]|uniref:Site-2 protease family protein n=1 Tax=Halobacillus shinanisalinarum TaxID=2932258 RepID=A0ABY4H3S6_9BACI|nr:site-2 protease family protein [Halobacillus shinanisalinarum]UOQ93637.1 site-2 protease family protein [Halobacillus shinanisalinarum]